MSEEQTVASLKEALDGYVSESPLATDTGGSGNPSKQLVAVASHRTKGRGVGPVTTYIVRIDGVRVYNGWSLPVAIAEYCADRTEDANKPSAGA